MSVLYLMRHGETLFNVQNKIQGWCDSPLTENGAEQAAAARRYFSDRGITFDHVYSSTSERACDTAEIITGGKPGVVRKKGLKEMNFGIFEGKDEFLHPPLPFGDHYKQFGGESDSETALRVSHTLQEIMEQKDHERVLAVSHGGSCILFYRFWMQYSKVKLTERVKNCTVFRYHYSDGIFRCEAVIDPLSGSVISAAEPG